jgi:hypothetical protein
MLFINQLKEIKMYKIYNNVEDKIIFNGNEREFIEFMNTIRDENGDVDYSILGVSDAIEYVEDYCGNLDLIS